ncbi:MAG: tetratricopeptide repeat protein [Planctomycetota bacterium]
MERDQYQRLRTLFQEACDLGAAARREFIDRECPMGDELRPELDRLLTQAATATTGHLQPRAASDAAARGTAADTAGVLGTLPRQLGHYQVDGELGRGGMGVVYDAVDERLGRRVALKVLPAALLAAPDAHAAFEREAQHLAALNHPNIATIFSLEQHEGLSFYTLERIDGQSLAQRLRNGVPPADEALRMAREMCLALEAAHRAEIVHLDFKPGNVMLDAEGRVKVLDFGIARPLQDSRATSAPLAGTPGYMAPEQIAGGTIDARTDLWALGCVLFEVAGGGSCFAGRTVADVTEATLQAELDWSRIPDKHALRPIIERCLRRDLDRRIESSAEVLGLLDGEVAAAMLPRHSTVVAPSQSTSPLPQAVTSFVGRTQLLAEIDAHLQDRRLVTLTGLGGSGKTRLAIEAARRAEAAFDRGACWIDLGLLSDDTALLHHVATAAGVRITGHEATELTTALRDQSVLLVLDNCEHVLDSVTALVAPILASCPKVVVLTTSREALGLAGETLVGIPPLTVPRRGNDRVESLDESESVQLLLARAARKDFTLSQENAAAIASICRRLDGIPLAIELAASRLQVLTAAELDKRLEYRFQLLTRGRSNAPVRQRTLRATLDWSYELLTNDEQQLLQRLSIFAGGWTLRAAEEVCCGGSIEHWDVLDLLTGLVNKSLVVVTNDDEQRGARYRFLETVRAYAAETWAGGNENGALETETDGVTRNYVDYYHRLSEEALPFLEGGAHQLRWLARLDADVENLLRAMELCLRVLDDRKCGSEIAVNAWAYWDLRSVMHRVLPLLRGLVDDAPEDALPPTLRAKALNAIGMLLLDLEDYSQALTYYQRCIDFCNEAGYEANAAVVTMNYAIAIKKLGDYDGARQRYQDALEITRRVGGDSRLGQLLLNLGILETEQNNAAAAQAYLDEALAVAERREDAHTAGSVLGAMGSLRCHIGDYDQACALHRRAQQVFRELGDRTGIARSLGNLGIAQLSLGDLQGSYDTQAESLRLRRQLDNSHGLSIALVNLAPSARRLQRFDEARRLLTECFEVLGVGGIERTLAYAFEATAELAADLGAAERSVEFFAAGEAVRSRLAIPLPPSAQAERDQLLGALRNALGPEEFDAAAARGADWEPHTAAAQATTYLEKIST